MYSHWHMHKVEECNMYKKMQKKEEEKAGSSPPVSQVVIDQDKLKKGMATLFPSGDFNTDDLAASLASAMVGLE